MPAASSAYNRINAVKKLLDPLWINIGLVSKAVLTLIKQLYLRLAKNRVILNLYAANELVSTRFLRREKQ